MNLLIQMGDSYPNESPAAKRMRAFSDVLRSRGHQVTVLAPNSPGEKTSADNVLYCPTITLKKKTTLMRMLNQLSFACSSLFVSRKAGQADVVLTTSPPALIGISGWLIAKAKGAKLVYDVRDIWPDVAWEMGSFGPESLYSRIFVFIRDFMLKHADLITAVSPGKVAKLKAYHPNADVAFITNGLDEAFLQNQIDPRIRRKYHMEHGFHCVYIGNLGWAQGLTQLLFLAEKAQEASLDVCFHLFGSGVEEASLKEYVSSHNLTNVLFPGRLPNSQMYTILKSAQMSFVSLVNENLRDSVPTKMFEALGVGCPVLLAAAGDAAQILEESKLGIAVMPNDKEALWKAFTDLYHNRDTYLQEREHAQRLILRKYSRQNAALALEQELLALLGQ